jgi:hypothetical protein
MRSRHPGISDIPTTCNAVSDCCAADLLALLRQRLGARGHIEAGQPE